MMIKVVTCVRFEKSRAPHHTRCGYSSPSPCVFFEPFSEDVASGSLASRSETWTQNRPSVPPVRIFHSPAACNNTLPCIITQFLRRNEPSGACHSLHSSMALIHTFGNIDLSLFLNQLGPSAVFVSCWPTTLSSCSLVFYSGGRSISA